MALLCIAAAALFVSPGKMVLHHIIRHSVYLYIARVSGAWHATAFSAVLLFLTHTPPPTKLCRLLLGRLNPLLGNAIALRQGSVLAATVSPRDNLWPAAAGTLRLEPIRVSVGQGAAATKALTALKLADSRLGRAAGATSLDVELSPLVADVDLVEGKIHAQRVDLSVHVPGLKAPLRVVTWGDAPVQVRYHIYTYIII